MKKRLGREEKRRKAVIDIINKMFEIAGHTITYEDIKDREDAWYTQWTMTTEQNQEWQKWGKQYLMKNFRLYARMAEREMQWISLQWGLKFENFNYI